MLEVNKGLRTKTVRACDEKLAEYIEHVKRKSPSLERMAEFEKTLPPNKDVNFVEQELDTYNNLGSLGWCYIYQNLLV